MTENPPRERFSRNEPIIIAALIALLLALVERPILTVLPEPTLRLLDYQTPIEQYAALTMINLAVIRSGTFALRAVRRFFAVGAPPSPRRVLAREVLVFLILAAHLTLGVFAVKAWVASVTRKPSETELVANFARNRATFDEIHTQMQELGNGYFFPDVYQSERFHSFPFWEEGAMRAVRSQMRSVGVFECVGDNHDGSLYLRAWSDSVGEPNQEEMDYAYFPYSPPTQAVSVVGTPNSPSRVRIRHITGSWYLLHLPGRQ